MRSKQLFTNGTDFMVWQDYNCCQCKRYKNFNSADKSDCCPHEYEISLAMVTDGTIPIRNYNIAFAKPYPQTCKSFIQE